MRSRHLYLTFAFFLAICSISSLDAQGKKVALVIGNSAYATGPLRNPANDAADIAAALREIGFSVALGMDANKKTMYQLVDQFGSDIRGADIALFYYSGHGVQAGGENYLIPVGADISIASDVEIEGVQLQRLMGRMNAGGAGTNIVILDACRNNPFPQASKGMEKGLAVVGQKPPESVIVYATEAGETADDGSGRNGVFTAALLRNIKRGEELTAIIRDVNAEVRRETNQKQKPAKYDNLTRAVYLAGTSAVAASASSAPMAPAPLVAVAPSAAPTLTVTRSYGSLVVSAATGGSLYLDGRAMGELPAGAEARLDNVEVGDRSIEIRYATGDKETKSALVQKGQSSSVSFSWKKAVPLQALPALPPLPALPTQPAPATITPAGMVFVPGGTFTMGSPSNEAGRSNDEVQHRVSLSGFYIGATEVTQAQYKAVMGSNPSTFKGDDLPVESISWYDAVAYCNKLSEKEGLSKVYSINGTKVTANWGAKGYRLPTEAEWEFAAKGGAASVSLAVDAVYAGSANINDVAWYSGNSGDQTHPVGQKAPNALGLYDMAGNVWEWCWDLYGSYSSGSQSDPAGASSGEASRVRRGGSWYVGGQRSAERGGNFSPAYLATGDLGFRVARRP